MIKKNPEKNIQHFNGVKEKTKITFNIKSFLNIL